MKTEKIIEKLNQLGVDLSLLQALLTMFNLAYLHRGSSGEAMCSKLDTSSVLEMIEERARNILSQTTEMTSPYPPGKQEHINYCKALSDFEEKMWGAINLLKTMSFSERFVEECLVKKNDGPDLAEVARITIHFIEEANVTLLCTMAKTAEEENCT